MWQFIGWLCLSALLFVFATISSLRTTDAWNKWQKKDAATKPKIEIKDSMLNKSPVVVDSPGAIVGENVVVNPKKPERQLNQDLKERLLKGLEGHKGREIEILYTNNDKESFNFANQFKIFLIENGWAITGPHSAMFFSSEPRQGINVDTKSQTNIIIKVYKQLE